MSKALNESQIINIDDEDYEIEQSPEPSMKGLMDLADEMFEEPDRPDLAEYFLDYDTTAEEEIRICRAYASYLVASQPPKMKRRKATYSPK